MQIPEITTLPETMDHGVSLAASMPNSNEQPPRVGDERTGVQSKHDDMMGGVGQILGQMSNVPGWGTCPGPTFQTYRQIQKNPIVAIGRMVIDAPVKAATWSIESDEGAPRDASDLIESALLDMRPLIMQFALQMLDFGFQPYELVWKDVSGAVLPTKFKALKHDKTKILADKRTGAYRGIRQGDVTLLPSNTLLFTHDPETTDDYYGNSLYENIRKSAWWPWERSLQREGQFTTKVAGTTVVVKYPMGSGKDMHGAKVDNYDLAKKLLANLSAGAGVAMPKIYESWATDAIARGADPEKLLAWTIDYLEPGRGHHEQMIAGMRHKEANMLRGLMVPERSVTEGKFGTKAESETQAGIAMAFSAEILQQIIRCLNWYVVDRILRFNYGEQAVGTVRLIAEELINEKKMLVRELVKEILANPVNADLWMTMTDVAAQLDLAGLPTPEGGVPDDPAQARRGEPSDDPGDDGGLSGEIGRLTHA